MKNLGFIDNDLIKIVSYLPKIILGDLTDINEEFSYLINYGYSEIDIINIVKKIPMILGSGHLDEVNSKIKCLEDFGFLKDEIINITCNNPFILLYTCDYLKWKLNNFLELNISKDDLIKMIINFPAIIGYGISNMKEKVEFYRNIGLIDMVINNSRLLSFSFDFIKARYSIITDNNIENEFYKDLFEDNVVVEDLKVFLFASDKVFFDKYHISREELLR